MIKAVIFDMDGLMIDSERVCYVMYKDIMATYGVDMGEYDYGVVFAGRTPDNSLNYAKEYFHCNYDLDEAVKKMIHYATTNPKMDNVPLKPGLVELLKYLKENNYKTAMATSSGLERVHTILDRYGVLDSIDEITCGSEVEHGKPAPDIFLKACEKVGVDPTEALVLEDSDSGIIAASSANIPVICIPDMREPREDVRGKTTAILPSLHQVIDFVKGENQ